MSQPSPAPVVVGVDGSVPAAEAARAAAREADRRRLPLRLVRAFHWPYGTLPGLPADLDARAIARRSANAELERLHGLLTGLLPRGRITAALVDGRPELVLRRESEAASLLVVGATGLTWGHGPTLGSVADAVASSALCPVLVHRVAPTLGPRRHGVVVGVDGGAGTATVLAAAAAEARLRAQPLRVVHAWRQLTEDAMVPLRWRLDRDATDRAERALLAEQVGALSRTHPGLSVEIVILPGRPGHVLVEQADAAELVVVGVRQLGTPGEGTTAHSVLHRCATPVLTVPVPSHSAGDPGHVNRAAVLSAVSGPLVG
jgi:nucleotide-binding universal stress UspA family protein